MHADGSRKIALHFVVSVAIRAFRSVFCGRRSEVPFGSPFWRVPGSETVRRRVRADSSSHNHRLGRSAAARKPITRPVIFTHFSTEVNRRRIEGAGPGKSDDGCFTSFSAIVNARRIEGAFPFGNGRRPGPAGCSPVFPHYK